MLAKRVQDSRGVLIFLHAAYKPLRYGESYKGFHLL